MTFLRWIVCDVDVASQAAFSSAQARWLVIANARGLVAQVGGWARPAGGPDAGGPGQACILSVWHDEPSYKAFMEGGHDAVFLGSDQRASYSGVDVTMFRASFPMPPNAGTSGDGALRAGGLRVVDCRLRPGRADAFVDVQRRVWLPGMAQAPGMLGGFFARAADESERFLVATYWEDDATHAEYVRERLPWQQRQAAVEQDLVTAAEYYVRLEPTWRVVAR